MKINRRTVLSAPLAYGIANVAMTGPALAIAELPPVDMVVIFKSHRKLGLYNNRVLLRLYDVDLGFSPKGDKTRFGDGRTPEGAYFVNRRNPNSEYHLSLGISYPDVNDVAAARSSGVDPGGDIFIHGGPTRLRDQFKKDWTAGCIAVTDKEIEEIWAAVPIGTLVMIQA